MLSKASRCAKSEQNETTWWQVEREKRRRHRRRRDQEYVGEIKSLNDIYCIIRVSETFLKYLKLEFFK